VIVGAKVNVAEEAYSLAPRAKARVVSTEATATFGSDFS
jgi:hypothetical protein